MDGTEYVTIMDQSNSETTSKSSSEDSGSEIFNDLDGDICMRNGY